MIIQILIIKAFKYKAKLFEKTEADGANITLRNTTVAVPFATIGSLVTHKF